MGEGINFHKSIYKSNIAKLFRFYSYNNEIISNLRMDYAINPHFILKEADVILLEASIRRFGIEDVFYRTEEGQKYLKSDFPDYRFIIKRIVELQDLLQRQGFLK